MHKVLVNSLVVGFSLTLLPSGNFFPLFCCLPIIFKINFFEKFLQELHLNVKQIGSRSGPMFCHTWVPFGYCDLLACIICWWLRYGAELALLWYIAIMLGFMGPGPGPGPLPIAIGFGCLWGITPYWFPYCGACCWPGGIWNWVYKF